MSEPGAVLVTGGAGYIGAHVVLALTQAGRPAVVIDDLSTGRRAAVDPAVPLFEGDVADGDLLDQVFGEHSIAAVMHLAGSIKVGESVQQPLYYYRNNIAGGQSLLEACARFGVPRFVFSSSAAVYGDPVEIPIPESAALAPVNPYGRTKLITEWQLEDAAAAFDLHYVALRYFNVAGADPEMRTGESVREPSHLIKIAAQVATGRRPAMEMFGDDYETPDGSCIRDYLHVSDLADLHLLALRHLEDGGENLALNCGYGHGLSNKEILAAVEQVTGEPLNCTVGPRRAGDPPQLISDISELRKRFNWSPRHDDIHQIIRTAIDWERILKAEEDG